MSPKGRGRRLLAALTFIAVASSVATTHRSSRAAELQILDETQATEAQILDSVILRWTAPGDDGLTGRAAHYDLRYSLSSITGTDTLGWWNSANRISIWNKVPALPSKPDSVRALGFTPGYRYYAMIRTCDDASNWSPFSNIAVIQASDLTPPKAVTDLRVR
ncbi:MAG TPA: hypothetical protein VFR25_02645 [Candidatus Eisenbacteria bacterium]|nr:hypothetical protein [Candidatus Eisenbacteria bacterium]